MGCRGRNGASIRCWLPAVLVLLSTAAGAQETVPLQILTRNSHDIAVRLIDNETVEIITTGADPYLFTDAISRTFDPRRHRVLSFEYFSATGTNHFQVFVMPPLSEEYSVMGGGLSISEGWT